MFYNKTLSIMLFFNLNVYDSTQLNLLTQIVSKYAHMLHSYFYLNWKCNTTNLLLTYGKKNFF